MAGAAIVGVVVAGGALVLRAQRNRKRTWLDVQLARLERRAGIPIDTAATLPSWLEQLPREQRNEFEPIVRALEHEAWAAAPLHDEDRRWVEQELEKVR
jgi:hypothetical protein